MIWITILTRIAGAALIKLGALSVSKSGHDRYLWGKYLKYPD